MPVILEIVFQALLRVAALGLVALVSWLGLSTPPSPQAAQAASSRGAAEASHFDRVEDRMADAGFREVPGEGNPPLQAAAQATSSVPASPKISPAKPPAPKPAPAPEPRKPTPIAKLPPATTTPTRTAPAQTFTPAPTPEPAAPTEAENEKALSGQTLPGIIAPDVDEAPARAPEQDDVALARRTTVNIVCLRPVDGGTAVSSGSGVVVSPEGLVETDAHVARFFLLPSGEASCTVTHPTMPVLGFPASAVYVSPAWIRANDDVRGGAHQTGTGESDYAFVAIEPSAFTPKVFDYAPIDTRDNAARPGDEVAIAGYPGAPKSLLDFGASLRFAVDRVNVASTFSFDGGTPDVLLTGLTPVAAEGASGGGLFKGGKLVGLIVTAIGTSRGTEATALTPAYVNRDLRHVEGIGIDDLVAGAGKQESRFASQNASLGKLLEGAL